MSRLDTDNFANGLILATPNGLHIGRIGDVDRMHIRTVGRLLCMFLLHTYDNHTYFPRFPLDWTSLAG